MLVVKFGYKSAEEHLNHYRNMSMKQEPLNDGWKICRADRSKKYEKKPKPMKGLDGLYSHWLNQYSIETTF